MPSEAKKLAAAVSEFLEWKKAKAKKFDPPAKSKSAASKKKRAAREDVEE